jgi:hypothetical protein
MPMNRHSMLGVAVVGVMALLIAGTVVPNAEAATYTGGFFLYSDPDEFWDKLTNEYEEYSGGFSFYSNNSEINEIISEYTYFVFNSSENSSERSLYLFGCFLPHEPPLIVGESVQCLVFFYHVLEERTDFVTPVTTITTNDLHVYVREPVNIPIQDWIWPPAIPNPFLWISDPITLNQAGQWIIVSDLIEHEIKVEDWTEIEQVVISLDVTFQVVPESIIGIAGVVAGPLAVLAYKLRKKSNAQ